MPGFVVQENGGQAGSRAAESTKEFLHTYTWEIFQLMENRDDLLIYAKDLTLPTFSVGTEFQQGASLEYKFAKNITWNDIKVTFYDAVGLTSIMKEWRQSIWTLDQGLLAADSYKKISLIDVYTPEWNGEKGEFWELTGSWPSEIKYGELTYTNSDVKVVEVTVTYDYAESEGRGGSVIGER